MFNISDMFILEPSYENWNSRELHDFTNSLFLYVKQLVDILARGCAIFVSFDTQICGPCLDVHIMRTEVTLYLRSSQKNDTKEERKLSLEDHIRRHGISRPKKCAGVIGCRTMNYTTWPGSPSLTSRSIWSLRIWILFAFLFMAIILPQTLTAADVHLRQDGRNPSPRRSVFSQVRELQVTPSGANLSSALSEDKSVLLSWRYLSANLSSIWVENDSSSPCDWPRVVCGEWLGENRITVVNLTALSLTGRVPAGMSRLSALKHFSLASNNFSGSIPQELGNCTNLQVMNLSSNMLTEAIPIVLGKLGQLQTLDLSRNMLNGFIPSDLFTSCDSLISFNVSSNNLTGDLPSGIGTCKRLRSVDVGNNSLQGEIPVEVGQLPLEELILAHCNWLHGSIPDSILSNCQNLRRLDVSWNQFTGPIPPKIGNCSNLAILIMQGNHFNGSIPPEFGKLKKLEVLGLGSNELSGNLPQNLSQCTLLTLLDVGNNSFNGTIPNWLGQLSNLRYVNFQINRFLGTIPLEITNLSSLRYVDLSANYLEGNVLKEFSQVTSLRLLRLAFNRLTGDIPPELGYMYNLQGLDLSSNSLTGSIPKSFGNLRDLLWLQLGNNSLTGNIPEELSNCSSLMWINLSKNYLTNNVPPTFSNIGWESDRVFQQNRENPWILDGVGECSILSTWSPGQSQSFGSLLDVSDPDKCHTWLPLLLRGDFTLRSNSSSGVYKVLGYWQLSQNNLTGTIPDLRNTTTLGFLMLSNNKIEGPIPDAVGNLPLYHLNVSHNVLSGSIPSALGNASLLITLDLSYNNLSGTLPPELGDLHSMTRLNVSYNENLTGVIPTEGQLTTLGWDPYVGDVNLCFNDSDPLYRNILSNFSTFVSNMPKLCSQVDKNVTSESQEKGPTERQSIMKALQTTFLSSLCTLSSLLLVSTIYCMVSKLRRRLAEAKKDEGFLADSSGRSYSTDKSNLHNLIASFGMPFLEALTYAHLLAATDNFNQKNIVGDGGFGIVYKARLASGITVAIKKLVHNGAQGPREFHAEMETLGMIQHENLVSLLGYCCNDDEMLLVYEYLKNGSLDDWLYESDEKASQLDWRIRLQIALEMAQGLAFLHHHCEDQLIIHRDMKSSNILLDENFKAVVTDFGMARIMDTDCTHVSTIVAGTPGYVPPEYSQTWRATTKGDVYSYGVVMLELVSGKRPTGPHFNGRCGANLVEMARILATAGKPDDLCNPTVLESGARQQIFQFLALALRCTEAEPTSRPTMLEVVQILEDIKLLPCISPSSSLMLLRIETLTMSIARDTAGCPNFQLSSTDSVEDLYMHKELCGRN